MVRLVTILLILSISIDCYAQEPSGKAAKSQPQVEQSTNHDEITKVDALTLERNVSWYDEVGLLDEVDYTEQEFPKDSSSLRRMDRPYLPLDHKSKRLITGISVSSVKP